VADPGRRDGETIRAKRMNMSEENAVVANFNTHTEVGTDVKESARSAFPMKRLSGEARQCLSNTVAEEASMLHM
jgi:hypothetical protein